MCSQVRTVLLHVLIATACVGCQTGSTELICRPALRNRRLAGPVFAEQRLLDLDRLPYAPPPDLELRLIPMLQYVNQRLEQEGVYYRVRFCFVSRVSPQQMRWFTMSLMEVNGTFFDFSGKTESAIRQEIDQCSIRQCLSKVRRAYGLGIEYFDELILLSPQIATVDGYPEP